MSVGLCSLDLHQRAGPQCWHGGEGQQPLHGGHCPGDPGCSGGGSCAGLRRHETLAEEEERWASSLFRGQTCLYNCYRLWVGIWDEVFQLEHPCCCVGCTGVLLLGLMIRICCEMFFSLHGRDPFDPQLQPLRHK